MVKHFTRIGPKMNHLALISVFEQVKDLAALPGNDFSWSSWQDASAALAEIDVILRTLRDAAAPRRGQMEVIFAPTGPLQELSLSSGWGHRFIALADRFDEAIEAKPEPVGD